MNRGLALARLVRLPNVFTALADVSVGLLFGRHEIAWHVWLAIPVTSASLYSAGMAWNDFCDRHVDRVERPQRPIPSGAISALFAKWLGVGLCAIAVLAATAAGWHEGKNWSPVPLIVAVLLVAAIIAYNVWLKFTWAGPWVMGLCRFLNMMLGFSVLSLEAAPWNLRVFASVALGLYVAGVSIIACHEVSGIRKDQLMFGVAVALLGWVTMAELPALANVAYGRHLVLSATAVAVVFLVAARRVIEKPTPKEIMQFVTRSLLGIVFLDALLATGIAGPIGVVIVLWLIPAVILGRWLYST
jgi:4-hydroxybenzoate polyprenyltransferase